MKTRYMVVFTGLCVVLGVFPAFAGIHEGLVAYYPFDGNMQDVSGNNNSGQAAGNLTYQAGKFGQAACFDGVDAYINVRRTLDADFTLSAWIKTAGPSLRGGQCYEGNGVLWSDVWGEGNDFILGVLNDKLCMFTGRPDASVLSASTIVTGAWVYVAATRDQQSGRVAVYVNGKYEQAMTSGRNILDANPAIHIGANTLDRRFFQGCLDDVHLYNRVLAEDEIAALFALQPAVLPPISKIPETGKMKIAVVKFQTLDEAAKQAQLGAMLAEMFTTEVVNSAAFRIVEREQLQKVVAELAVGQSGILDTTEAQEVGKMLGADAIITGSVIKMGTTLRIDARIIEVKTGMIVSAESRLCEENIKDISAKVAEMTAGLAAKFYQRQ